MQEQLARLIRGLLLYLVLVCPALAQQVGAPDPLFRSDEALKVTLEGPLTTILRERSVETQYPATIRYEDVNGEIVETTLRVRARGNFRRQPENCRFPPIRLRFRGGEVAGTIFEGLRRVPLVTHCQNTVRYQQGVLREYMAYRILNELTDFSLDVRLFEITYIDTEGGHRDRETYAFAIEHRDRLAARSGNPVLIMPRTWIHNLDAPYLNKTSVFQFMIGNTDFSPILAPEGDNCCHNHRLFGKDAGEPPQYAVPYDFDMTGIVNLPHSAPNPRFNIRNVTQRLYRGRCVNNELLPRTIEHFQWRRNSILDLINNLPGASSRTKSSLRGYINGFYNVIDSPNRVQRELVNRCI